MLSNMDMIQMISPRNTRFHSHIYAGARGSAWLPSIQRTLGKWGPSLRWKWSECVRPPASNIISPFKSALPFSHRTKTLTFRNMSTLEIIGEKHLYSRAWKLHLILTIHFGIFLSSITTYIMARIKDFTSSESDRLLEKDSAVWSLSVAEWSVQKLESSMSATTQSFLPGKHRKKVVR